MLSIGDLILNSLDYILIVDSDFNIIFNTRYDPRTNTASERQSQNEVFDKRYFDIYPDIPRQESSVARCMATGEVVACKNQVYTDRWGNHYKTNSITVPIRRLGQVVAVAELAQDAAPMEEGRGDTRFDELVEHLQRESGLISFETIMTRNPEMLRSIQAAKVLSTLPNPTLIYGETGTGKEMFAQAMITHSGVPRDKVVVQNCAAVPENLIESILFGTEKGAYTGAERRTGLFQEADGGILFLDELSSMPYEVQAKLLRVLQDGTFRTLGGRQDKRVSVKVICAMNVDPVAAMEEGTLRKDLFYRLSSSMIRLIPLRERPEDIELFIDYYVRHFGALYGKRVRGLSPALRQAMLDYPWEGNVRELRNAMEYMIEIAGKDDLLDLDQLPVYLRGRMPDTGRARRAQAEARAAELLRQTAQALELSERLESGEGGIPYEQIMERVSRSIISDALERCGRNKTRTSELLGLPRQTLKYKLDKLGLD